MKFFKVFLFFSMFLFSFSLISAEEKSEVPSWVKKMKFSGDLRLRYQYEDVKDGVERHRFRIRMRFGFTANLNESTSVGLRLATGSGEQVSTNQTLTDAFSGKNYWLDRGYLEYKFSKNFSFSGGKIANPFFTTDLAWDDDINPEGFILKLKLPGSFQLLGGYFPIRENSSAKDVYMDAAELSFSKEFLKVGFAYYLFTHFKGATQSGISPYYKPKGNTLENDKYLNNFKVLSLSAEVMPFKIAKNNFYIVAQYLKNNEDVENDKAFLYGIVWGKIGKKNSFEFGFNIRRLEADAIPAIFADSDFNGGGTDYKGQKVWFKYAVNDSSHLSVTYFVPEALKQTRHDERKTFQIDFITKF